MGDTNRQAPFYEGLSRTVSDGADKLEAGLAPSNQSNVAIDSAISPTWTTNPLICRLLCKKESEVIIAI